MQLNQPCSPPPSTSTRRPSGVPSPLPPGMEATLGQSYFGAPHAVKPVTLI